MQKFRKIFIVEAVQFTGENADEIIQWGGKHVSSSGVGHNELKVLTDGIDIATIGDWIIKTYLGFFFVIKQEEFNKEFEAA